MLPAFSVQNVWKLAMLFQKISPSPTIKDYKETPQHKLERLSCIHYSFMQQSERPTIQNLLQPKQVEHKSWHVATNDSIGANDQVHSTAVATGRLQQQESRTRWHES